MENINNSELLDLGSEPTGADFDPFAFDDDNDNDVVSEPEATETSEVTEQPKPAEPVTSKPEAQTPENTDFADKSPVFEYAGATETVDDVSKTFDELRIEKLSDFPELEDGKRVSWTVEYGKITKTVADPKGTSVGKVKSDIETSKEFEDSLKKRGADKNPTCKVKPRVTAQSKGTPSAYKGVFANLEEAELSGKVISIVPGRDGTVYEIRDTEMGRFTTPVGECELLSEVKAGFVPALPRVPATLMSQAFAFFRHFVAKEGSEKEALLNIYWDKENQEFIIDAPEQIVTKVSVDSRISEQYATERYIHYMDIHSHNTMSAFFSPVDDHDEKATRLYAVVGKLNERVPEMKTRISNGGKFWEIEPSEVFESVEAPFPEAWVDNVRIENPCGEIKAVVEEVSNNVCGFLETAWAWLTKGGERNAVRG